MSLVIEGGTIVAADRTYMLALPGEPARAHPLREGNLHGDIERREHPNPRNASQQARAQRGDRLACQPVQQQRDSGAERTDGDEPVGSEPVRQPR